MKYIAFVGAGGKTSLMEHFARGFLAAGKRVAVTTTTKIYAVEPYVLLDEGGMEGKRVKGFVRVGRGLQGTKLTGISNEDLKMLGENYDVVLVEADGARGMPLKFPASHEPVVPPFMDRVFVLCGLDALGARVDEKVFRWELFAEATGIAGNREITPEVLTRFYSPDILLKGLGGLDAVPVFNKVDALRQRGDGREIAKSILSTTGLGTVIISSVRLGVFYAVLRQ